MKVDYAIQRKIDDTIIQTLNTIGHKCRLRIEILDGDNQVIESEATEGGKWKRTDWHHKAGDDSFSIFPEFRVMKKVEELVRVMGEVRAEIREVMSR
jgi:hypothetical protein